MVIDDKIQHLKGLLKKWVLPLSVLVIFVTSFSLYHKSVNNSYLNLDDLVFFVKDYPFIKDISNAPKAFTQGVFQGTEAKDTTGSYYRPMLIVSFMIDAQISPSASIGNPSPKPFLTANILYHTFCCVLLLFLLLELNISAIYSLLLALVFTVHPLLNQAVAWIPGRNDPLLSIFILLSLLFLFRYHKTKKNTQFFLHILFFLLALFTKENAVMFIPLVFIFLRVIFKEPFSGADYKKLGIAYILCIIPWLLIRQYALSSNRSVSSPSLAMHNLIVNSPYFIQYAGKAILPFHLSVMSTPADTNYFIGLFAIALLAIPIVLSKEKNRAYIFTGISWFFLFITPTFSSGFSGLEHRAYLPLMGVIIIASQLDIIKKREKNNQPKTIGKKHIAGLFILMLFIALFYALSASRLYIFRDRYTFDKSAMQTSPGYAFPCQNLGDEYKTDADSDYALARQEASIDNTASAAARQKAFENYTNSIAAYREALKRDSTLVMAHNNIATEYIRMRMYPEAEKELRLELSKYPKNHEALFNLGYVVLGEKGDTQQCIALLKKSISLDSAFTEPYKVLSQLYQIKKDTTDALLYRNLFFEKTPK